MKLKKLLKEELVNLRKVFEDSERNDKVLNWNIGLVAVGQDDKTSVPVSRDIPVAAVAHQSGRGAIVPSGHMVQACDHDFTADKIVPSVKNYMNIGRSTGESLYSGDEEGGNGTVQVALHDHTFEPSNIFAHHSSVLLELEQRACLQDSASEKDPKMFMPYLVLMEADGGPDHNIPFNRSKLAATAFLLYSLGCGSHCGASWMPTTIRIWHGRKGHGTAQDWLVEH
jgi:hypothetical protein